MSLRALSSSARFFLRIGQAGRAAKVYDDYSLPLFSLPLLMDAEGMLAPDAHHLVLSEGGARYGLHGKRAA